MQSEMVQQFIAACEWDSVRFFVFSSNVFDPFIYYSHITPLILSILVGAFVIWKNPHELINRILFSITALFSAWVFFDLIVWATDRPDFTIFFWSTVNLIEPLIYLACVYFIQVFITKKDTSFKNKLFLTIPILPILFLTPTDFSLIGYDLSNCDRDAIEGPLALYGYFVEVFYTLYIAVFSIEAFTKSQDKSDRHQILLATTGILLFLLTFVWGNIVGSFSDDWRLPQWGLFGMPVFIAFLSYLVVRYELMSIKVLGAQVLVFALVALIASELLFVRSTGNRILVTITLTLAVFFGFFLVRSVQKEVRQRQLIQKQEEELEVMNAQQVNLLHFISHEIKGYLTKSEAAFAAISEGDYGVISEQLKSMSTTALADVRKGVATVMDILDASNLKKGTVTFKKTAFDFRAAVQKIVEEQRVPAREKNLTIETQIAEGKYQMTGDEEKIREHVIRNLIDNAIRYTPKGSIRVELSCDGPSTELGVNKIHFSVKDSGVGITPEDMSHLFTEGGHGKDSIKINVHSTGYGLFIAKQIVEAFGGTIKAESEGAGKGSRFIVELPAL